MIWREQKRETKRLQSQKIYSDGVSTLRSKVKVTVVGLLCINSIMLLVGEREARLTDGRTEGSVKGGTIRSGKAGPAKVNDFEALDASSVKR